MAVKQELIDLYHDYLSVTNNQAAAACLVILDVLGQGPQQTHLLITGDTNEGKGFMTLEEHQPAQVVESKEAERPDEWGKLLDAYRELKRRV